MPGARASPYQYAVLRVVPSLERGERLNAGVVLLCRPRGFVGARVGLDEARLRALAPGAPVPALRRELEALAAVAAGAASAGPLGALPPSERFGWLAAPTSTLVQPGAVHTGLCDDPAATLERLFDRLVRVDAAHRHPEGRR